MEEVCRSVKRGTTLAVVGPNDHGKTTLFKALLSLVPYTGTIRWSDKAKMWYVPQRLIATCLQISVREFLEFKCKPDFYNGRNTLFL